MKLGVVIPAAGRGKRMKAEMNKQFLTLVNRPVLAHTIEIFCNHPQVNQIIVVSRKEEMEYCQKKIIDKFGFNNVKLVAGGKTRRQSVYAGLLAFPLAIDYVIIHDGARPLISNKLLNRVIAALNDYSALTTGFRVKNTIKIEDSNKMVAKTLNRDKLVAIQTPQAFSYDLIVRAHRQIEEDEKVFDDASLVEKLGKKVKIIKGSAENIKITTPVDLSYAKLILKNRNGR